VDDYRFETAWSRPLQTLVGLGGYGSVLTPDFSLYRNWPKAVQLWNTYRTRWLGAFWQAHGLKVIPSVGWSTPDSFEYCFLGLPVGMVVAIAATDYRDKIAKRLFMLGFEAMLKIVQPSQILCYGSLPSELASTDLIRALVIEYPTRWTNLRDTLAGSKKSRVNRLNQTSSCQQGNSNVFPTGTGPDLTCHSFSPEELGTNFIITTPNN
jgi:hypothetical protein